MQKRNHIKCYNFQSDINKKKIIWECLKKADNFYLNIMKKDLK